MRRSIRRATTVVASTTTPTMTSRCQSGMRLYSTGEPPSFAAPTFTTEAAPAGEALVEPVPVADLVLTELPAEQHVLLTALRREIEQPLLERLDLGAGSV